MNKHLYIVIACLLAFFTNAAQGEPPFEKKNNEPIHTSVSFINAVIKDDFIAAHKLLADVYKNEESLDSFEKKVRKLSIIYGKPTEKKLISAGTRKIKLNNGGYRHTQEFIFHVIFVKSDNINLMAIVKIVVLTDEKGESKGVVGLMHKPQIGTMFDDILALKVTLTNKAPKWSDKPTSWF